ncbi:MAG: IS200/IS605 family transposase [Phycisphaerae bacterium]|jgi:REP element-mobilizing transposase RayT
MPHSYSHCLFHCVWSTRRRKNLIPSAVQDRLWAYVGGAARTNDFVTLAVGGTGDHMHALLALPATMPVAKAVQLLKAGSSKWLHDTFAEMRDFAWQEGYAAFTIGVSQVEETTRYIARQTEHHATRGFDEEYVAFLERHGIAYDKRYVFG